ncbi:hypothetical protein B0H13DRAFT_1892132 [Mycena leptocephala]|nr:hypothetical protein B0H13DRAFT_1892132 [Mycena leptocephala]
MSIAQAHGIFLEGATNESLREAITQHVGMGMCVAHEEFAPFSGCSSLESEVPPNSETGSCNDPSVRLQIRQLMPVSKTRPLRRLLELHDVSYLESENAKKLRQRLKSYLIRLRSGKYAQDIVGVPGTNLRLRAQESSRLRKEWPQLVPARLKNKLLANFNMEISQDTLATFVCGSCSENCPIVDKCTLGFEDFDINLLSRPDDIELDDAMSEDLADSDDPSSVEAETDTNDPIIISGYIQRRDSRMFVILGEVDYASEPAMISKNETSGRHICVRLRPPTDANCQAAFVYFSQLETELLPAGSVPAARRFKPEAWYRDRGRFLVHLVIRFRVSGVLFEKITEDKC